MIDVRISPALSELGFKPFFSQRSLACEPFRDSSEPVPARIACERRGEYEVLGEQGAVLGEHGAVRAKLSGRLEHELTSEQRPAVGDWVLIEPAVPVSRITHVLERQSVLRRRNVDGSSQGQALAANVDLCIVVAALAPDDADQHTARRGLNLRRLERYLLLAREAKIPALIAINKADLPQLPEQAAFAIQSTLREVEIELVSAFDGRGIERLRERVEPGATAVLLGSSGVGKSTLANRLLGREIQRTGAVRDDDGRGRHTTTERELLALPGGGLLIDTPGMRELGLWADAGGDQVDTGFADIDALATGCHFRDCTHHAEPSCAVLLAIENGTLALARLESARKLEAELRYQRARTDVRVRQAEKQRFRARTVALREWMKKKRGD